MKIGERTFMEVSRQIDGLLMEHEKDLNLAFLKVEDALGIAFGVKVKPLGDVIEIKTEMSFTMEKIKDSSTGRVSEMPLFKENPFDKRTRLHCLWMIDGGRAVKGDFEAYLLRAA